MYNNSTDDTIIIQVILYLIINRNREMIINRNREI